MAGPTIALAPLPAAASWRHTDARTGFEVAFFTIDGRGVRIEGSTTATENDDSWIVDYAIRLDNSWSTRWARITGRGIAGAHVTEIEADGTGNWTIDGIPAPRLRGCLDLDLESSAMTNTFPIHRLRMRLGSTVSAPAAYVRATGLAVERLEQTYTRSSTEGYDYAAPDLGFRCPLTYDVHGLVVDYPGIATRVH
ncbi:putative glycolipid-binding domain-containing protein [Nocardia sp. NPDC088792]|uniref:putative glycolipid-binding domain-containing protein n=1 Tax=Nocardia sp. NPDC088792 TaxID=3364332 RepID=UPI003810762A